MKKIFWYIVFPIILVIVFVWAVIWNYVYAQQKAHMDRLESLKEEVEKEKNKKSEIELIEESIAQINELSNSKLEDIKKYKALTRDTTKQYETSLLIWRCLTEQLTLKVNWKDYNTSQCEDNNYIQKYRKK